MRAEEVIEVAGKGRSSPIRRLDTGSELLSAGDARVPVSFIVPAFNAQDSLPDTIASIRAEAPTGSELIVVDDGSTDQTVEVARELADRVLVRPCQGGAARARNDGAQVARGDILVFVDSDVIVGPGAIPGLVAQIEAGADAVFGAYQPMVAPDIRNAPTTYKNLLHHYTHLEGAGEASTFWSGFGGVRRSAFAAVGGFDPKVTTAADIEDIHLGYRLKKAGFRIVLDPTLQVGHRKRYTLGGLIASDIFHRAIPWTRAMLELGFFHNDLNLSTGSILASLLTYLVLISAASIPLVGLPAAAVAGAGIVTWWWINGRFLGYVRRHWGTRGMFIASGLHALYYLYGPIGAALGFIAYLLRHDHHPFLNRLELDPSNPEDEIEVSVAVIWTPTDPPALPDLPPAAPGVELLVVGERPPRATPPHARYLAVPPGSTRNALRDLALRHARGGMLALLDAQHAPQPGWLECVRKAARRADLAVGGSFGHDRSGPFRRAYQVARFWQWRPERRPGWVVEHPSSNLAVRTAVVRALGGFREDGALMLRLAGFGARPVRFDPEMQVRLTGTVSLRHLTRGLAGIGRLRAAASVRYFDVSRSARFAAVAISPGWALAGFYYLIRSAVREGSADRSFWLALPLSLLGAASYWVGRNLGTIWSGQRGGVVPWTDADIARLATDPLDNR